MNSSIKNNYKKIYFLCGNTRTFMTCFESTYENIINKLFSNNTKKNTHVLFYLKCDDPGPKGQDGWNFTYPLIDETMLKNKISEFTKKYNNITFHSEILPTNKIKDSDLLRQVKNRELYTGFFSEDSKFVRALHCHYNIENCGKIINQIESHNKFNFDFYIYIRPDLFFKEPCHSISEYDTDKIITHWDYIAIIPHKYKDNFFFERMNLIRTNDKKEFHKAENIYFYTIKDIHIGTNIGISRIKRK